MKNSHRLAVRPLVRILKGFMAAVILALVALPQPATAAADAQGTRFLPTIAKNACHDLRTPTVFGLQYYGALPRTSPYFAPLQNSGASWIRVPIYWTSVEPNDTNPSQFKWDSVDEVLRLNQRNCMNLIVTITDAPAWARRFEDSPNGPLKEGMMGAFVEFVTALVERYDGDGHADAPGGIVVNYWELYNEPDQGPLPQQGTAWDEYGSDYAAMLKAIYQPIHSANPNARVVFGGIGYDGFVSNGGTFSDSFLTDVLDAGGGNYFDVMNFHYYTAFRDSWKDGSRRGLPVKTDHLRQVLADYGLSKPMVLTETGWHGEPGCGAEGRPACEETELTDEVQSQYVVQLFTQSIASDIDVAIWFSLHDMEGHQFPSTGLVTQGPPVTLKPAYFALQTLVARLSGATFHTALSAAETQDERLEVYHFAKPNSATQVYVAWVNEIVGDETRTLSLSGSTATLYDKVNAKLGVVRDGDDGAVDGSLTIQVGRSPIYIEVN